MSHLTITILTSMYAAMGVIGILGYLPTIKDLWHDKKPSANLTSYGLWTMTSGITFMYSLFVLQDKWFRIISGIGFISCVSILGLCLWLKRRKFVVISPETLTPSS
jgi:hypothetical protein